MKAGIWARISTAAVGAGRPEADALGGAGLVARRGVSVGRPRRKLDHGGCRPGAPGRLCFRSGCMTLRERRVYTVDNHRAWLQPSG